MNMNYPQTLIILPQFNYILIGFNLEKIMWHIYRPMYILNNGNL